MDKEETNVNDVTLDVTNLHTVADFEFVGSAKNSVPQNIAQDARGEQIQNESQHYD
jgi:hypothetical protein